MRWLADENFDNDILRGIWRRRIDFDVVRVQDFDEISGLGDSAIPEWATTNERFSFDTWPVYDGSRYAGSIAQVRILLPDNTRARLTRGWIGHRRSHSVGRVLR